MPSLNTPAAIPDAVRRELAEMRREAEQWGRPAAPSLNAPEVEVSEEARRLMRRLELTVALRALGPVEGLLRGQ